MTSTAQKLTFADRAVAFARHAVAAAGLERGLSIERQYLLVLDRAPRPVVHPPGLIVRPAIAADRDALIALHDGARHLVDRRLDTGDVAWVAEQDRTLVGRVWFHRGPAPYIGDAPCLPRWLLGPGSIWEYDIDIVRSARQRGLATAMVTTALAAMFESPATRRVLCRVHYRNPASLALHRRLGFTSLGPLTNLHVPGAHFVVWKGRLHVSARDLTIAVDRPAMRA